MRMDGAQRALSSPTPFASLLLAVFNSIVEVFLLCAAGYILACHGILDKKTQKQLNRLNVSLFTPALLFSKVAFSLTPEKLKELWVIPIWFVIVTATSMLVGRGLGWLFKLRRSQRSFVMAAAMFMNSNALPIALMQSLVVSVPDLMWDSDDNKNAMLGRALTYLTMYSTLGMVLRYSYGVNLLARADTIQSQSSDEPHEQTPLLSHLDNETLRTHPSSSTIVADHSILYDSETEHSLQASPKLMGPPISRLSVPKPHRPASKRRNMTFYNSFPNSPNDSQTNLAAYDSTPPDTDGEGNGDSDTIDAELIDLEDGHRQGQGQGRLASVVSLPRHLSFSARIWRKVVRLWVTINNFMTVPLWSAVLSLLVACIEPLKHALENHLVPLNNAINTSGKCAVPLTLVVLGAYFYVPPDENAPKADDNREGKRTFVRRVKDALKVRRDPPPHISTHPGSKQPCQSHPTLKSVDPPRPGEKKTIVLAILARMIITPVLLTPFLVLATRSDWHAVFEDPVFAVVNVILLSSPPALTLAQITQAVSGDAFERLISGTIFWSYCFVTPPITILCVVMGLLLAKT